MPLPLTALLALLLALAPAPSARAACDTTGLADGTQVAELVTSSGSVCFELLDDDAPGTVENFLYYLQNDLIRDTFFHRSVPGFVLQGGGFRIDAGLPESVPRRIDGEGDPFVVMNEPCTLDTNAPGQPGVMICSERGNVRGSVALAKVGGDPNSGSTNWFINLADNRAGGAQLDTQNGGFTVFARVIQGMSIVDAIAGLTLATRNDIIWLGSNLGLVPQSQFTITAPLREPPLYDVFGQYGCFDPERQITILDSTGFTALNDPIDPALLFHTLSSTCGTPTTRAAFVADPGPPECPDADRIGVSTPGPARPVNCLASGVPVPCANADHFEFTCAQAAEALAQRTLWRADFQEHMVQQLVYVESAAVTTVPEAGAGAIAALAALALWRRAAGVGARR
jgi:cyclophilin family peptidyl-prolyl cis-trans isomerase